MRHLQWAVARVSASRAADNVVAVAAPVAVPSSLTHDHVVLHHAAIAVAAVTTATVTAVVTVTVATVAVVTAAVVAVATVTLQLLCASTALIERRRHCVVVAPVPA